jgi:hypothetical protein
MAAEEDKKFDAVLGGFLVNDPRVRAGHLHCPESDVLAAYHERSLLPDEMNSWKEHIVGCARCQAILAELEATDSISIQASEKVEGLLPVAAKPAAVAREDRRAPPARAREKPRVASIYRGVRWQWLAPAGALAAGLLVWVAWHENRPLQVKAPSDVNVAEAQPPSRQEPSATQKATASPSLDQSRSDQLSRLTKDEDAVRGEVSAKKPAIPENLKQLEKSEARAKAALAKPPANKEKGAREDAVSELLAANPAQNQAALDNKAVVAGAATETVEVQTSAASAPVQKELTQQTLQNQSNAQKTPGPSPHAPVEQTKKAKSESESSAFLYKAPAAPPPAPAAPAFSKAASMGLVAAYNPHLILVPGTKTLWRVGLGGLIEFSSDRGASWSRQVSDVSVDLTTGSAPSDKVCWIVGRAGTVLLTTDAGSHWAIAHSPLDEDLGGVRATDSLHAVIWTVGNLKFFETKDGGKTWKKWVAQE